MSIAEDLEQLEKEIIACRRCPRLVAWREELGRIKRRAYRDQEYWAKPVPGFGDADAKVLVLGLAPGAHGSNRTGRMFTGDASGDFLYPALYRAGFASQPYAKNSDDGLLLSGIFITALCRCVPPDNKPTSEEINNCRGYLLREIQFLPRLEGIVALGKLAYDAAVRILDSSVTSRSAPIFSHGAFSSADDNSLWLLGSYHPSRQNTQTGRLTVEMFDQIWEKVDRLLAD
jgi:uracil-DNA glycosylase family 4